MNQEMVKAQLQKLHDSPIDYTLIFSGKKSDRVNGLYKADTREIIIHNRNFLLDGGDVNESLLMFMAIHELAHHIRMAEKGDKSARAHNQNFWACFHDLIDRAESMGIYRPEIDKEAQTLIDEAREISRQIAELQRNLGQVLLRIQEVCHKKGLSYEDIAERKAQISRQTQKISIAAFCIGDADVGVDIQAEAAKERNESKREAVLAAGREGKSVVQAKQTAKAPAVPPTGDDETPSLIKEKRWIERTIESLTRRLEELEQQIISRGKT